MIRCGEVRLVLKVASLILVICVPFAGLQANSRPCGLAACRSHCRGHAPAMLIVREQTDPCLGPSLNTYGLIFANVSPAYPAFLPLVVRDTGVDVL